MCGELSLSLTVALPWLFIHINSNFFPYEIVLNLWPIKAIDSVNEIFYISNYNYKTQGWRTVVNCGRPPWVCVSLFFCIFNAFIRTESWPKGSRPTQQRSTEARSRGEKRAERGEFLGGIAWRCVYRKKATSSRTAEKSWKKKWTNQILSWRPMKNAEFSYIFYTLSCRLLELFCVCGH